MVLETEHPPVKTIICPFCKNEVAANRIKRHKPGCLKKVKKKLSKS